ncbi:MAG: glutaminyl-peptide cyclotransferase [Solirubrobacteraceae bacterium]|nr:glutaminyl-peptide cyclotransferase [Solirubrobacteraceae bacterium]
MRAMLRTAFVIVPAILALSACGGGAKASPAGEAALRADRFDADAAFALIRRQVAVGQRPAGTRKLRRLAVRLRRRMPHGRFERIPGEPRLRNVVAVVKGARPALVVGAHYDTLVKPKGFVGANNGAAGSAIVVQLAREAARAQRAKDAPELRFVLFDGEEPAAGLPEESTDFYNTGLRGSRAYVKRHRRQVGAMVLLDYVAGKDLSLPREASSTESLWDEVRAAAHDVGASKQFPADTGVGIVDDHSPFLRASIPAVDLIDWNYPGHSLEDGMDLLSVDSVDAVGETLTRFIAGWRP